MAQQFTPEHIHERTDAKVRPLIIFLIVMTVTVVASFAFTGILFEFFEQRLTTYDEPVSPVRVQNELPEGPQLQVVPGLDLRQMEAATDAQLDGYGWVDENDKTVHIPLESAIDVLLDRGFPVRSDNTQTEPQMSETGDGQTSQ